MVHIGIALFLAACPPPPRSRLRTWVIMGTKPSLSGRISGSNPLRYSLAPVAVLIALLLSTALNPFVGDRAVFLLLLPAVAFAAWYCGIGPSILAIVLALAGAMYGVVTTLHPFPVITLSETVLILT